MPQILSFAKRFMVALLPARPFGAKRASWPARAFPTQRFHTSETGFHFLITGVLVHGQDGAAITTHMLDLHFSSCRVRLRAEGIGCWLRSPNLIPWTIPKLLMAQEMAESGALFVCDLHA